MGESVGVLVALSAGLFSFLSPCVLPLFPSYLSFITGMSLADLSGELTGGGSPAGSLQRARFRGRIFGDLRVPGRLLQRDGPDSPRPS